MINYLRLKRNSRPSRWSAWNVKAALTSFLLLMFFTADLLAQTVTVTGTVISADSNEPFPGANIIEKGTNNGAVTDANGKYSISTSQGAVLLFSFVGYEAEERIVGDQTVIDVTLTPSISELQEVVVVGYGTMLKRDLTGSIVSS